MFYDFGVFKSNFYRKELSYDVILFLSKTLSNLCFHRMDLHGYKPIRW